MTIEEGLALGAKHAALQLRVINFRRGTAEALLLLQVEILRQVALNALGTRIKRGSTGAKTTFFC